MSRVIFEDKVNNPELEAMFSQFPPDSYVSAEDINALKNAINSLYDGGGVFNAAVIQALPVFANEADALSLADFTPYKTPTGEIRYKLPTGFPEISFRINENNELVETSETPSGLSFEVNSNMELVQDSSRPTSLTFSLNNNGQLTFTT